MYNKKFLVYNRKIKYIYVCICHFWKRPTPRSRCHCIKRVVDVFFEFFGDFLIIPCIFYLGFIWSLSFSFMSAKNVRNFKKIRVFLFIFLRDKDGRPRLKRRETMTYESKYLCVIIFVRGLHKKGQTKPHI